MSLKKSLGWMALAQAIAFAVQFASTVVLARYLTPHEVGISAVAFAVVAVVAVAQQLGLPALIVREEVLTDEIVATAFTVNVVMTLLLSVAIAGFSFVGAAFLGDPGVQRVLLVLAIPPLFGIFSFLPGARLERNGQFKRLALIGTISGIIGAAATIAFAVAHFSYLSVAYGQTIGSGSLALLLMIAGREHISHKLGFRAWKRVYTFGFQIVAISGINTLSSRLSEVVMGRLLGLSALGLFSRANGINALVWNNIHVAASKVLLVDFAEIHRNGLSLRDRYLRTVAIVTAVLWPAFAGLIVVAEPFIVVVYGEKWAPAALPFALLAVSSIILVAMTMTWELFAATGQMALQTKLETAKAVFGFAVFTIGCCISLEAAAAARIIDCIVAFLVYRPHVNRLTDTATSDYWPIYGQSLLATGCAIAPAAIVMTLGAGTWPLIPVLGIAMVFGAALWLGSLFAMRHPVAQEIATTLANRRSRVQVG